MQITESSQSPIPNGKKASASSRHGGHDHQKKEDIRSYSAAEIDLLLAHGVDQTDWQRVDAMDDDDIDCSDIPEITEEWLKKAIMVIPETKERLTVRFDRDIVSFFRHQGKGYQTRMNAILRAYMEAQQPR